jgi:dihydrofolate synthase/folylpolyglutamate synthase
MISEADVVRLVQVLRGNEAPDIPHSALRTPRSHDACPTFFEFVTVVALQYFAEQQCDLVIWETGLGGRLDATNIVTPLASVITNVEFDHQEWLGHDLRSIAAEKAGIIKPGVPIITAAGEPEALAVIQEHSLARNSPLTWVTPAQTNLPPLDTLQVRLSGWHQRMNAATALATVGVLQSQLPVSDVAIRQGLETVSWPGRLHLIERPNGQRILVDGAHNAAGAAALRAVVVQEHAKVRPVLILGILQDKDWESMCEILSPLAESILCVPVNSMRSASPVSLAEACGRTNPSINIRCFETLADALESSSAAPFVLITGSLYLVGEAMEQLQGDPEPGSGERVLNDWR